MRIKIFFNVSIILVLCLSMAGCGATNKETSETLKSGKTEVKELKATDEILNADIYSQKLQLGNSVVTFPVLLSDLLDLGAEITNDVNPETEIIEPRYSKGVELNIDDWIYTFSFRNNTGFGDSTEESKRLLLKDCICDYSYFICTDGGTSSTKFNKDIIYPKGVRPGMSVSDLKAAWGEPTETDINKYMYYSGHSAFEIIIDLEKEIISEEIYYQYHELHFEE